MDWQPQQLFTALQAAAGIFLRHAFGGKVYRSQYLSMFYVFSYLGKHQIDEERNPVPTNGRVLS